MITSGADAGSVDRARAEGAERASQIAAVLVRSRAGALLELARRFVPGEEAAEVVRAAFVAVLRRSGADGDDAALGARLRRVVVDLCLAKLRVAAPAAVPIDELLPRFDATGHHARHVEPWARTSRLDPGAERAAARRCIDRLPAAHRVVVLLCDVEGLAPEEAARRLGLPSGVVETRLSEARQALVTLLGPLLGS